MPSSLGAINSNNIATQTSFCQVGGPVSQTERSAIIKLTDNIQNDPVAAFIKNPHQTRLAQSAVLSGMQKDLPQPLIKAELSPAGERVKNLVGVIYGEVKNSNHPDDIKTLDNICNKLIAAHGNAEKESKIKGDLSGLVTKYGAPAFEKTINTFIDNCAQAWQEHHDARSINVENRTTFTADLDVCKSALHDLVKDLNDPKLAWEMTGQKMNQFVDGCTAISKAMTFYNPEPASPAAGEPVRNSPAVPQAEPGNKPDVQSLTLPAGPGNGPITLHITNTSTGGSVGDINNSSGGAHSAQSGHRMSDFAEILNSNLSPADKYALASKWLDQNTVTERFLNKIENVGNPGSDVTDRCNPHRTETVQDGIEMETATSRSTKEPHWIKTEPDGFKETATSRSTKEPHWIKTEPDGFKETPTSRSAKEPHWLKTELDGIEVETPTSRSAKEPHWLKTELDGIEVETPTSRSVKEPHWLKTELDGIEVETPASRSAKEPHWIKTELDDIEVETPTSRSVKEPHWLKTELDGIEVETPTSRSGKEPQWLKTELDGIEVETPTSRSVKEPQWLKTEMDGIEVETPTSRSVKEPHWLKTELDGIKTHVMTTDQEEAVIKEKQMGSGAEENHIKTKVSTTEQDLLNDKLEKKPKREGFNPIRGLPPEERNGKWPTVDTSYLNIYTTERVPDTFNRLATPANNKTFTGS
jgi:hypothetical protein